MTTAGEEKGTRPNRTTASEEQRAQPDRTTTDQDERAQPDSEEERTRPTKTTASEEQRAQPDRTTTDQDERAQPSRTTASEEERAQPDRTTTDQDERAQPSRTTASEEERAQPDRTTTDQDERAQPDRTTASEEERAQPDRTTTDQDERTRLARGVGQAMADMQAALDADDQALADHLGIHRTDLRALDLVYRHGPLPAGRLATLLGLTPGSVTALVDRLVRVDYVGRKPDPTHGRRVLITSTPRTARLVAELLGGRLAEANAELASFSDAELAAIQRFLRASTDRHNRSAAALRAALPPAR